jgi:hypothetical protein
MDPAIKIFLMTTLGPIALAVCIRAALEYRRYRNDLAV